MISASECRKRHAEAVLDFKKKTAGENVETVLDYIGRRLEEASLSHSVDNYEMIHILTQKKSSLMMLTISEDDKFQRYRVWADREVVMLRLNEAGYKVEVDNLSEDWGMVRQYLKIQW